MDCSCSRIIGDEVLFSVSCRLKFDAVAYTDGNFGKCIERLKFFEMSLMMCAVLTVSSRGAFFVASNLSRSSSRKVSRCSCTRGKTVGHSLHLSQKMLQN